MRIGILGNNENDCDSPDSVLGVGLYGYDDGPPYSGARCEQYCPGEVQSSTGIKIPAFAWVWVR